MLGRVSIAHRALPSSYAGSGMVGADSSRVLRSRIAVASIALVAILLPGATGLWALGRAYLGDEGWSYGDCAFMTVTTITTVGFDLPHLADVPGGRLFMVFVLLSGLGVALYFVSALTTYFIEGEFTRTRLR